MALVTRGQSCRRSAAGAACAWAVRAVNTQTARRVFRALLTDIYLQREYRGGGADAGRFGCSADSAVI